MPSFQHFDMFERCGVKLTQLKQAKSLKAERFYTFDTETTDGLIASNMFCWAFAEFSHGSFEQSIVKQSDDLTALFNRFDELKDKKRYTIVFVHNLDFDIRFIIKHCLDHDIEYQPLISGSSIICCVIQSLNVKFIDTMQFLKCEQHDAEIIYNINKQYRKINCDDLFEKKYELWTKKDKERLLNHNKNDVIALHLIIQQLRKDLFEISNVDFLTILTPASLSMKSFRKTLKTPIKNPFVYQYYNSEKKHYSYDFDKEKYEYVRKSYFGGHTEVYNTAYYENITTFDAVSRYPSVMKYFKYPSGWGINYSNNEPDCVELTKMIRSEGKFADYEGFIECTIHFNKNIKYPVLAEHRDNKLMFTNCTKKSVFTLPELRYIYSLYNNDDAFKIIPISGFIFTESEYYFSEYIDKIFAVKQANKGSKRELAKLLMNSLYGKFGQAFERKETIFKLFLTLEDALNYTDKIFDESIQIIKMDNVYIVSEHKTKQKTTFSDYKQLLKYLNKLRKELFEIREKNNVFIVIEKYIRTSIKTYFNVCIASYITAYARIELMKQFKLCEDNNIDVKYCDTDSFSIKSEFEHLIPTSTKLGAWDVEKRMKQAQFFAPKCYIYQDLDKNEFVLKLKGVEKRKIKSILKSIEEKRQKHEISDIDAFNELREIIHQKIHLAERFLKYKSAMRTGKILNSTQISQPNFELNIFIIFTKL